MYLTSLFFSILLFVLTPDACNITQAHTDKRIRASLHARNKGTGSSKLKVTLVAVAIVSVVLVVFYFALFAFLLPRTAAT